MERDNRAALKIQSLKTFNIGPSIKQANYRAKQIGQVMFLFCILKNFQFGRTNFQFWEAIYKFLNLNFQMYTNNKKDLKFQGP